MKKIFLMASIISGFSFVTTAQERQMEHFIGEKWGGGVVFYITPNKLHGLIAETKDQNTRNLLPWCGAGDLISNPDRHSNEGKNFTDWRLPTGYELNLMCQQKAVIGGFAQAFYWSSTDGCGTHALGQNFSNCGQLNEFKTFLGHVRAIRSF